MPCTSVDKLLELGRSQGHLSISEIRRVCEEAGLSVDEGRDLLQKLAINCVQLDDDSTEPPSRNARRGKARSTPPATRRTTPKAHRGPSGNTDGTLVRGEESGTAVPVKAKAPGARRSPVKNTQAKKTAGKTGTGTEAFDATTEVAAVQSAPAKIASGEDNAGFDPATAEEFEEASARDLDDSSSVVGDAVHAYLQGAVRRKLLTA